MGWRTGSPSEPRSLPAPIDRRRWIGRAGAADGRIVGRDGHALPSGRCARTVAGGRHGGPRGQAEIAHRRAARAAEDDRGHDRDRQQPPRTCPMTPRFRHDDRLGRQPWLARAGNWSCREPPSVPERRRRFGESGGGSCPREFEALRALAHGGPRSSPGSFPPSKTRRPSKSVIRPPASSTSTAGAATSQILSPSSTMTSAEPSATRE